MVQVWNVENLHMFTDAYHHLNAFYRHTARPYSGQPMLLIDTQPVHMGLVPLARDTVAGAVKGFVGLGLERGITL